MRKLPWISPSTPLLLTLLLLVSCQSDCPEKGVGPVVYDEVAVVVDADAPAGLGITAARVAGLLAGTMDVPVSLVEGGRDGIGEGALVVALGPGPWTGPVISQSELVALGEESYILRLGRVEGRPVLAAAGSDLLGHQYAAYALLDEMGFGFFHPEETYIPALPLVPDSLDETFSPSYHWRGFHAHTMHPIELMDALLVPGEAGLEEAKRCMHWLVANRVDYLQWPLLRTVDMEAWIPHATAIADYAHTLGLRIGIDVSYKFMQQNTYMLMPGSGDWEAQLRDGVDRILQVDFDVINVEMGTSEFLPTSDTLTMEWLNATVDYLEEAYVSRGREVELIVKIHCSTGQTAPNFGDINFNFLPGLADPRVGVMPHSVQFYDLYRTAPTYDNEDFSHIREFLLAEIGERRVLYYPETAYWVSFDVDLPIFLPHYVYSRWNDLHRLDGSGMDGQIVFSSGFEWGYWLNDYAAAMFAYEAALGWTAVVERFSRIFGPAAEAFHSLFCEIVEEQGSDLLEDGLIGYMIGYEPADDLGLMVGIHAQPEKVLFSELGRRGRAKVEEFEAGTLAGLAGLSDTYHDFSDRLDALRGDVPGASLPWFDEIADAVEVTSLRADHVYGLYRGVVARRKAELGMDPQGLQEAEAAFAAAVAAREAAASVVGARRASYRYPADRLDGFYENPTTYEFGYLYTSRTGFYWLRDEAKAIDGNTCPCNLNITNLIDTAFGEGPLGDWFEGLPPLSSPCLDQCVHWGPLE